MLQPAILLPDSPADLTGEIDRARRIGDALADPADQSIVQGYIAELEARIARGAQEQPARH
ncbi:MAG TPA: hypothetical protein VFF89_10595 [Sphingobium sp.]|nr:hypothetical protein [Sphingobium sp.]